MSGHTALYNCVQVQSIRLVHLEATTTLDADALPESPPPMRVEMEGEGFELGDDTVEAKVTFRLRADHEGDASSLYVHSVYVLRYIRPTGRSDSKADLDQFAQVSGVYNAWPFWRELLSSIYGRMELPFPLLPSLTPDVINRAINGNSEDEGDSELG